MKSRKLVRSLSRNGSVKKGKIILTKQKETHRLRK